MKPLAFAAAFAVALAGGLGLAQQPSPVGGPVAPPRWEFHVLVMTQFPGEDEKKLNALGAEGWEVSQAVNHRNDARVILRRPKR
jgi:hypothetical protein